MSTSTLLLTMSPLLLLIAVFGAVVIVALLRARPEDVPAVMREAARTFKRLANRLPSRHPDVAERRGDDSDREGDES